MQILDKIKNHALAGFQYTFSFQSESVMAVLTSVCKAMGILGLCPANVYKSVNSKVRIFQSFSFSRHLSEDAPSYALLLFCAIMKIWKAQPSSHIGAWVYPMFAN